MKTKILLAAATFFAAVTLAMAADPSQAVIAKRDVVNRKIEEALRQNSPAVYRLFGMENIIQKLQLSNVRGGQSAYCFLPSAHPNVPAGCYVEFYIMQNSRNSPGIWYKNNLCGALVSWYAPWDDLNHYQPNSGMAHFIADHNTKAISSILDDDWRMCHSNT